MKLRGKAFDAGASVVLLLLSLVCLSGEARAQWATSGNNIHNTNPGNVGVGTTSPAAKLDVTFNGATEIGVQI
ncbi:MAG TPA: hypothetical protein VGV38_10755, partial [Pyrinomonadaceae bacterium]|nr:hypothetical protein [Pyrinomonadaceae bacterium]